jgi:hypothetical protein
MEDIKEILQAKSSSVIYYYICLYRLDLQIRRFVNWSRPNVPYDSYFIFFSASIRTVIKAFHYEKMSRELIQIQYA